jgi:hypothetical protein
MLRNILMTVTFMGLALASLLPVAANASMITENTNGGYLLPKEATSYRIVGHCLYATDGAQWYVLRAPEYDRGFVRGMHFSQPEQWIQVGGSRVRTYVRSPRTFRDQSLTPVFIEK